MILETADFTGGRNYNWLFNAQSGQFASVGSTFFNPDYEPRVLSLIKEFNLSYYDASQSLPVKLDAALFSSSPLDYQLSSLGASFVNNALWTSPNATYYDQLTLSQYLQAIQASSSDIYPLTQFFKLFFAFRMDQVSALYGTNYFSKFFPSFSKVGLFLDTGYTLEDGTGLLSRSLARAVGSNVIFNNVRVTDVNLTDIQSDYPIRATYSIMKNLTCSAVFGNMSSSALSSSSKTIDAKFVVLATSPLAVSKIRMDRQLVNADKLALMKVVTSDLVDSSILITYASPWWRQTNSLNVPRFLVFPDAALLSRRGVTGLVGDLSPTSGSYGLLRIFLQQSIYKSMTNEQLQNSTIDFLTSLLSQESDKALARNHTGIYVWSWPERSPEITAVTMTWPPGVLTSAGPKSGFQFGSLCLNNASSCEEQNVMNVNNRTVSDLANRVYFSGSEFDDYLPSWMEGALRMGESVGNILVRNLKNITPKPTTLTPTSPPSPSSSSSAEAKCPGNVRLSVCLWIFLILISLI